MLAASAYAVKPRHWFSCSYPNQLLFYMAQSRLAQRLRPAHTLYGFMLVKPQSIKGQNDFFSLPLFLRHVAQAFQPLHLTPRRQTAKDG